MRRHDIVIVSSGNLEVNRKQDTYYLEIKGDFSKCYCLSLDKIIVLSSLLLIKYFECMFIHSIYLQSLLRLNIFILIPMGIYNFFLS